jgi:type II secretory pathway component HofQ
LWTTLLTLDARVLTDFLNYTAQKGHSKVVTSTKVTMVNSEDIPGGLSGGARGTSTGTPATIQSIVPIPFTVVDPGDGPLNAPNERNELINAATFEGIKVDILPFIGSESITLQVDATVNSLLGYSKDTDFPLINTRTMHSVVNLKNGEPVVLGGLDKVSNVSSRVGIPGLKDIPVIKYLFSKESKSAVKSKVLVTLRPRLKTTDTEAAAKL